MTVDPSETPIDDGRLIDWNAVLRGALVGLCVLIGVSVVQAILDHNLDSFDDSGWIYPLFVMILVGYALGGWLAGRLVPDAFLTNGALAGVGAFVLWIPVRIVIWLGARRRSWPLHRGQPGAAARAAVRSPRDRCRPRDVRWLPRFASGRPGVPRRGRRLVHGSESAGWPRTGPSRGGTGSRNVRTPQGTVLGNTQSG